MRASDLFTVAIALWGSTYLSIGRPFAAFLADAAADRLPHVSFVEPRFLGEEFGLSNDDHPYADIRNGEAFLNLVYSAVTQSPAWPRTLLIINYDEWGGFFDHVPPTTTPIPPADELAANQDGRRGFRTPCLLVSPFAQRDHVAHLEVDHTSILKMIEWRWNLEPLTVRDESANNLAEVLDFGAPDLKAKQLVVPTGHSVACSPVSRSAEEEWQPLLQMAVDFGWPVRIPDRDPRRAANSSFTVRRVREHIVVSPRLTTTARIAQHAAASAPPTHEQRRRNEFRAHHAISSPDPSGTSENRPVSAWHFRCPFEARLIWQTEDTVRRTIALTIAGLFLGTAVLGADHHENRRSTRTARVP